MNQDTLTKFFAIIVIVIFGSGAAIWGFNKIQGKDLSKAPDFDLSAYDSLDWPSPVELIEGELEEDPLPEEDLAAKFTETVQASITDPVVPKFKPHSVYFSRYFRSATYDETNGAVDNFLNDFEALREFPREDLYALQCVVVNLPVEGRADLISQFEALESVRKVAVSTSGAPYYDFCFENPVYPDEVSMTLAIYPGAEVITIFDEPGEYSTRIDFGENSDLIISQLETLKKDFSDVVKVVD